MFGKVAFSFVISMVFTHMVIAAPELNSYTEYSALKKALNLYQDEDYDAALINYSNALSESEYAGEIQANLGSVFYQKGDYEKAIEAYEKALETADESLKSDIHYNMGNAYVQLSKKQEAIDAYVKSLENRPDDVNTKYNLEVALNLPDPDNNQNQQNPPPPPPPNPNQPPPPPPSPKQPPPPDLQKKLDAKQVLNALEQLEKEARKRYRKQPPERDWIEFDW